MGDRWRKEPHIKEWATRATKDTAIIKGWWRTWPDAFVGVALVRVGLVVLDADRHGGPDGVAMLREIELPPHPIVATMSGGEHHFFSQCEPPLRSELWAGGEVLGEGRFVVSYSVEPFVSAVPQWPNDLLDRLPKRQVTKGNGGTQIKHTHGPSMVGDGRIPKSLHLEVLRLVPLSDIVTRHHQRRVIGILSIVTGRRELRNDGLNIASFCFRELVPGVVPRDVAERLLYGAAQVCGYVEKDGDRAAMATIRSGLGPAIGGPCVGLSNEECRD